MDFLRIFKSKHILEYKKLNAIATSRLPSGLFAEHSTSYMLVVTQYGLPVLMYSKLEWNGINEMIKTKLSASK